MIGDAYFQIRSQIDGAIRDLRAQAEDLGADIESLLILDNLAASLSDPFVFVVVGEVNVGKSTFLNALFGQDFSRTGVVPTTDKILFFKHGEVLKTVAVTPTLEEVHVPSDFLKDFHIVDTPGTNSIADEHQQITERFVPVSDLVIFVFSAANPWAASAWQFLEKVHRDWMRNVVFVLQQCDTRTPEEIQVITDYMRQLAQQRFGREFPLFPVSAKHAYLARSSGLDRDRLLNESGFTALESYISKAVTATTSRTSKLRTALQLAAQSLHKLIERVSEGHQVAARKSGIIQELVTERDLQIERTQQKIRPAIDATERDYHESAIRVSTLAADTLSTQRAFSGQAEDDEELDIREAPPSLDHRLFQDLQHHNGDRWRQVALILDEDVRHYERYILAQGRTALPPEAQCQATTDDDSRFEVRRHFMARVDSAIRRFVVGLELDQTIEPGFKKAARQARMVPRLILPVIIIAGLAWYFESWRSALVAAGAGLCLMAAFYILTKVTLSATRRQLIDKLEASSGQLHELLTKHVTEDVESAFERFSHLLLPVMEGGQSREKDLAAQAGQLQALAARFQAIEESLRKLSHSA